MSLLFLRTHMKVVPFGIQRCNKLPKGGNNDSIWVMLWMEPLQKISMILLSTCSPPGRVQRERLQMKINNRLSHSYASWQVDITFESRYYWYSIENNSHDPDAKYLQATKTRFMYKNDETIIFLPQPIYCDLSTHLLFKIISMPFNHTYILWNTIS